jgi:hypothetical protein
MEYLFHQSPYCYNDTKINTRLFTTQGKILFISGFFCIHFFDILKNGRLYCLIVPVVQRRKTSPRICRVQKYYVDEPIVGAD